MRAINQDLETGRGGEGETLAVESLFLENQSYAMTSAGVEKIAALSGPDLAAFEARLRLKQRDHVRERRTGSEVQRVDVAMRVVLYEQKARAARMTEIVRWKLVAEEMPDAEQTVLGFHAEWGDRCEACYFDGDTWVTTSGSTLDGRDGSRKKDPEYSAPTHWAPWPAGPKGVAK